MDGLFLILYLEVMEKESITLTRQFPVTAARLYQDWLDSSAHSAMTGGEATTGNSIGNPFTAWDGYIAGENLELDTNRKIVQTWRTTEFDPEWEDSRLEILLEENDAGTELTLIHSNLAPGDGAKYADGWKDHYFEPMAAYYSK